MSDEDRIKTRAYYYQFNNYNSNDDENYIRASKIEDLLKKCKFIKDSNTGHSCNCGLRNAEFVIDNIFYFTFCYLCSDCVLNLYERYTNSTNPEFNNFVDYVLDGEEYHGYKLESQ